MFIATDNGFVEAPEGVKKLTSLIPVGNYNVSFDPIKGYILNRIEDFKIPDKIYGEAESRCTRIIKTFNDRIKSTGILLAGEKGSGKTLLAKLVCKQLNCVVLIISAPFSGSKFNNFIHSIDQPCVVFFDEFEKVYNEEQQQEILSLFDGTQETKKLFLITVNNLRIDRNLLNRPGRCYYHFKYDSLSFEVSQKYIKDNLLSTKHLEKLQKLVEVISFNFDSLAALIEELNRFPKITPLEAIKELNIEVSGDHGASFYTVRLLDKNETPLPIKEQRLWFSPMRLITFQDNLDLLSVEEFNPKIKGADWYITEEVVCKNDLISADYKNKVFDFKYSAYQISNKNEEEQSPVEFILRLKKAVSASPFDLLL